MHEQRQRWLALLWWSQRWTIQRFDLPAVRAGVGDALGRRDRDGLLSDGIQPCQPSPGEALTLHIAREDVEVVLAGYAMCDGDARGVRARAHPRPGIVADNKVAL